MQKAVDFLVKSQNFAMGELLGKPLQDFREEIFRTGFDTCVNTDCSNVIDAQMAKNAKDWTVAGYTFCLQHALIDKL